MSTPLTTALETVLNGILRLDPDTLQRLGELDGKLIRLDLGDDNEPLTLFVEPGAQGLSIRHEHERAPDVTLRGSIPVFARLARTGIAAGELQISGDVELGSRFKRALEGLDPDWEEPLARLVGDAPAHQFGRAVRAAGRWTRLAAQALAQDSAEYLQEEARILAPRVRVEEFLGAVDALRADADRLQKRIEQLTARAR